MHSNCCNIRRNAHHSLCASIPVNIFMHIENLILHYCSHHSPDQNRSSTNSLKIGIWNVYMQTNLLKITFYHGRRQIIRERCICIYISFFQYISARSNYFFCRNILTSLSHNKISICFLTLFFKNNVQLNFVQLYIRQYFQ